MQFFRLSFFDEKRLKYKPDDPLPVGLSPRKVREKSEKSPKSAMPMELNANFHNANERSGQMPVSIKVSKKALNFKQVSYKLMANLRL